MLVLEAVSSVHESIAFFISRKTSGFIILLHSVELV